MRNPLVSHVRSVTSVLLALMLLATASAGSATQTATAPAGAHTAEVRLPPTALVGADRVQTSAAAALEWVRAGGHADRIVVVPAGLPGAALLAAPLAARLGTLVLLSDPLPTAATREAADAIGAPSILLVTDEDAMASAPTVDAWRTGGVDVEVLHIPADLADGGAAIGQAVLDATGSQPDVGEIVMVGMQADGDLMAAAVLASHRRAPLLLAGDHLPQPVTDLLAAREAEGHPVSQATIIGGPAAIPTAVDQDLVDAGLIVNRLAGADRGATSVAVASTLLETGGPTAEQRPAVLLVGHDGLPDAAAATSLADALDAAVLIASPAAQEWLTARCGTGVMLTTVGGDVVLPTAQADAHRRAVQHCDPDRRMRVPVAVIAVGPGGQPPADADAIIAEVTAAATGASGWSHGRVEVVLGDPHQVGIILAHRGCGDDAICRHGRDLVVDLDLWRAADTSRRQRLIDVAIGNWLGQPISVGCTGHVMDPLMCADVSISHIDRSVVTARFSPSITLAFAGDVHAERHLAGRFSSADDNPLEPVRHLLEAADLTIVNLETPLSTRGRPVAKTFTFRGPPATARALADVGVDVVTLANNHALDFGQDALADTLVSTAGAGLAAVGAGPDADAAYGPHLVQTEVGTVAIVGLTRVLHTLAWEATTERAGLASAYDVPAATAAVRAAAAVADHVIVAIHWGTERAACPDGNQRALVPALVDAGADVIVGHHPHVLQGVQQHGDSLIAYSLGNFVWYHNSAPSRFTGVLEIRLPLLADPDWSFTPAEIDGRGSPVPSSGAAADAISRTVRDRSPGGSAGCAFPSA